MADETNDFDVAKSLFDHLRPLDRERQQRILRWVAESLEITLHVKPTGSLAVAEPPPSGEQPQIPSSPQTRESQGADIRTFVDNKSPKSDVQFAAVVAYYYRFEAPQADRRETITSELLQASSRLTGRKRLDKPNTTLNNAKNLGYLDSAGRGEFRINTVGENLVAMTLPSGQGEAPSGGSSQRPPRKRTGKKRSAANK